MPAPANLIHELSTTTGTGNLTTSAVNGKVRFSDATYGFSTGVTTNVFDYFISNRDAAEWEIGTGHMSAAGTMVRDTVVFSSNANAAVSFSAGTKDITNDIPAAKRILVDAATALTSAQQTQARANLAVPGRNILINGRFAFDQANVGVETTTADAAYGPDMWKLLGEDSNGKIKGRDTTVGGGRFNCSIKCVTANKKYGIVQFVEGINCKHLRGQAVTLSANLSVSNARLGNIKMGIIEWTGTEDAPTSDPISAWNADGTTPTLVASYAFINTPANLSVTTSPAGYSVTATLGSTFTNLAVLIWNDDAVFTANDLFYVTDAQLELGSVATSYEIRLVSQELDDCERYYEKSYDIGTAPGTTGTASMNGLVYSSYFLMTAENVVRGGATTKFSTRKRTNPTVTAYSPATGATGKIRDNANAADITFNLLSGGETAFAWYGALSVAGTVVSLDLQYIADARL